MPALVDLVVINELVIRPLRPTPGGLIVLARKDAHGSRNRDIGGVVEVELALPIEASRGNRGVRQPIEGDVIEKIISCKIARGVSIDGAPYHR